MALTCQVARVLAKNPGKINPKDFKLEFDRGVKKKDEKDSPKKIIRDKELVEMSKQKAMLIATGGGSMPLRIVDAKGNLVKRIPSRVEMIAKSKRDERAQKDQKAGKDDQTLRVPRGRKR